jgi:hypothetical protein
MPAVAPVVAAAVPAANAGMTPFAPTPAVAPAPMFAAPAAAGKPSPAALAGPNDPTVNVDPSATPFTMGGPLAIATSAPVVAEPTGSRRRGGVPVGMWVLMAGVGVFGIAIGIFLRPSGNSGSVPAQTAARSTPPPATDPPITRSVAAEIHLPADPPPTPPAAPAAPATPPPAPAASTPAMASTAEAHHAASHANTVATAPAPPHALNAAQLAAINALGAQTAGVAQSSGPTTTQLRNTPQPTDSAGGGLTGQARAGQVIEALRRSNVVDSCWTAAQRRNPAHPGEQIRVQLDVLPTGRAARVSVSGSTDPDLSSCIQNRARANPYGSGGQITAEVSFSLVSGQ